MGKKLIFIEFIYFKKIFSISHGDWGLGIGDWGLGIGPNPQSPIPNPHEIENIFLKYINSIKINFLPIITSINFHIKKSF